MIDRQTDTDHRTVTSNLIGYKNIQLTAFVVITTAKDRAIADSAKHYSRRDFTRKKSLKVTVNH